MSNLNQNLKLIAQKTQAYRSSLNEFSARNEAIIKKSLLSCENPLHISTGAKHNTALSNIQLQSNTSKKKCKAKLAELAIKEILAVGEESGKILYFTQKLPITLLYAPIFNAWPKSAKIIFQYMASFYKHQQDIPDIATIARMTGYNEKTVDRALPLLHSAHLIYTYHQGFKKKNEYMISQKGIDLYHILLKESLSEQELYSLNMGITLREVFHSRSHKKLHKENVPLTKSYINNNIYFKKLVSVNERVTNAQARDPYFQQRKNIIKGIARLRVMLNEEQKRYITENKHKPASKDALMHKDIWPHIITPNNVKLTQLLGLSLTQQLQLICFREDILESVYKDMKYNESYKGKVKDHFAYALSLAKIRAKEVRFTPEWQWYYTVCEILNIPAVPETATKTSYFKSSPIRLTTSKNSDRSRQTQQEENDHSRGVCAGKVTYDYLQKEREIRDKKSQLFNSDKEAQQKGILSLDRWLFSFADTNMLKGRFPLLDDDYIQSIINQKRGLS